jgi:hypothetical protein
VIIDASYTVLNRRLVVQARVYICPPRAIPRLQTLEQPAVLDQISLSLSAHAVLITSEKETTGEKDPPTRRHNASLYLKDPNNQHRIANQVVGIDLRMEF